MSDFYKTAPVSEEECIRVIHEAVERGCMLDTSDIYGPFTNEELIGRAIAGLPRDKVTIATKFGIVKSSTWYGLDCSRKHVREACEASLGRLGVEYIDLYYMHRKDPNVPIEETMAELKALVEEGKIKYIGVSETNAEDIRRAHAVHPLTAVQIEWNLWSRQVEDDIIPTCRELGIGIVAYAPLGRGFLSGKFSSAQDFPDGDLRASIPRFSAENFDKNKEIVDAVGALAASKGVSPGQLAIAWVLSQGDDVVPIPGTKRATYLKENLEAASIKLTNEELHLLSAVADPSRTCGEDYAPGSFKLSYRGYVNAN